MKTRNLYVKVIALVAIISSTLTSCSTTKSAYSDDIYYSSKDINREKQIDHRYPESNNTYYSNDDTSNINPNSGYYKQTYTTSSYYNTDYTNSYLYNPYYLYGTNFHLGYSLYGYGFNSYLYTPYWYYPYNHGYWNHQRHNWGNNWNHNWNHGYNSHYYYGHRNMTPQRSQPQQRQQYQQRTQSQPRQYQSRSQPQRNFLQTNHNSGGRSISAPSHNFGGGGGHTGHSSGGGRGRR